MASIRSRGSRTWQVRFTERGRERSVTIRGSRRQAQELADEITNAIRIHGVWNPHRDRCPPALKDVWAEYLRVRAPHLARSTLEQRGRSLDVHLRFALSHFGAAPTVECLSRPHLEDYYAWLLRPETGLHGRGRSEVTAKKMLSHVQIAWAWAWDSERWPDLVPPARQLDLGPRPRAPEPMAPTWAQMDLCIACLNGWQRQLGILMRYTGLRVGDALALRWSEVDLRNARMSAWVQKTSMLLEVPLSEHLVAELARWDQGRTEVVPCSRRTRKARGRDFRRGWERSGVPPRIWAGFTLRNGRRVTGHPHHAFRSGFASGLHQLGAKENAVRALLGQVLTSGAHARYLDKRLVVDLRSTVALIPPRKIYDEIEGHPSGPHGEDDAL